MSYRVPGVQLLDELESRRGFVRGPVCDASA